MGLNTAMLTSVLKFSHAFTSVGVIPAEVFLCKRELRSLKYRNQTLIAMTCYQPAVRISDLGGIRRTSVRTGFSALPWTCRYTTPYFKRAHCSQLQSDLRTYPCTIRVRDTSCARAYAQFTSSPTSLNELHLPIFHC